MYQGKSLGKHLVGQVAQELRKCGTNERWHDNMDLELMELVMLAAHLFYPTRVT